MFQTSPSISGKIKNWVVINFGCHPFFFWEIFGIRVWEPKKKMATSYHQPVGSDPKALISHVTTALQGDNLHGGCLNLGPKIAGFGKIPYRNG